MDDTCPLIRRDAKPAANRFGCRFLLLDVNDRTCWDPIVRLSMQWMKLLATESDGAGWIL